MSDVQDPSAAPNAITVARPHGPANAPAAQAVRVAGDVETLTHAHGPGTEGGIWHKGNLLVMSKAAALPDRCLKCNLPAGRKLKRRLYWHEPAWYLLLLASPLIYIVVALCIRKSVLVHAGLCPKHRSRRRWVIFASWMLFLSFIPLGFVSLEFDNPAFIIVGLANLLIGPLLYIFAGQVVTPSRIDDHYAWLKGAGPKYLATFPPTL